MFAVHGLLFSQQTTPPAGAVATPPSAPKAAGPSAAGAITLSLPNGDRLSGNLKHADGKELLISTEAAGDVTVSWAKLASVQSAGPMVVETHDHREFIGTLAGAPDTIVVTPASGPPATIPVGQIAFIVDQPTWQQIVAHPSLAEAWSGVASLGLSMISATQNARSFNGGFNLTRQTPPLAWLPPSSRTLLAFQGNYGKLSQPGFPTVLTDLYTGSLEQDKYLAQRLFIFGDALLNHNRAQGVQLQQNWGGGVGWTVFATPTVNGDVKVDLHYLRQALYGASAVNNLLAATLAQTYARKLVRGLVFTEALSAAPALTQSNAYQASGSSSLTMPVSKRLGLNVSLIDSIIGNPQPGFRKNSLQFTTGIQFSVK
jgi:hypothetical protein